MSIELASTKLRIGAALGGLSILWGLGASSASAQSVGPTLRLPDGSISSVAASPAAASGPDRATGELTISVINTSARSFPLRRSALSLSADGDIFGVRRWSLGGAVVTISPHHSESVRVTFSAPGAAVKRAAFVYRPTATRLAGAAASVTRPRRPSARRSSGVSINTFPLRQGVGEPWGLARDRAGNIWFAEPGCDFEPTCPAGTPPGQIGELKAYSHAIVFHTLPNRAGNQPIFLAFDGQGNLWFTTPNNSRIGEFRPSTGKFIGQWAVTGGSGPWDLTFSDRTIWYTEHLGAAVGSFNPSTHRHRDYRTPSANSNPYGIAAEGGLIWFTENNSAVDRVAVLNPHKRRHEISEYSIVRPLSGTPHMITVGPRGHPWWTEGFSDTIATLNPAAARPGRCGRSRGTCKGIRRFHLPPGSCSTYGTHVSGIAFQPSGGLIWLDNSLTAQVGFFDPRSHAFGLDTLPDCDDHPHDGLVLDPHDKAWVDEEFGEALGELSR